MQKKKGHKGYPIAAFAIFISPPRARTRAYPEDDIPAKVAGRNIQNPCWNAGGKVKKRQS